MDQRIHGWLFVCLAVIVSSIGLLGFFGLEILRSVAMISGFVGLASFGIGFRFLWRTGTYQLSPLWRVNSIAIGLLILGYLFRIMHWGWSNHIIVLAVGVVVVSYSIHFYLKPRKTINDILRLLVVLLAGTLFPLAYFHFLPGFQAFWAVIGMMALATLEYLLNPSKQRSAPKTTTSKTDPLDNHDHLENQFPELFG
jgi:hypothetical protein